MKFKKPHIPALSRSGALSALGFLLILAALLSYPELVRQSVGESVSYCLQVLVPSLFPFMALACYGVNSPASQFLGRPFAGLTRRLFRLPGCCTVTILMSFIGGYPAGARGVSLLLEKGMITREQAGRMMLFCVGPGIAFVITFLGAGMLGSVRLGVLLFISVTFSGLLLGVIASIWAGEPEEAPAAPASPIPSPFMRSVSDASKSMLVMCACVVLFSGFRSILRGCGLLGILTRWLARTRLFTPFESAAVLAFLLEVTGGVGEAMQVRAAPVFYAFGLAFGGLCVHLQVFSFFQEYPGKLWQFFLCRFVHGLMSAGCFLALSRLLPNGTVQAFAAAAPTAGLSFSGSFLGGASLLLMCGAFLLIAGDQPVKARK